MASPIPKQLGQLLKEQQEPFDLEDYLDERGYMKPYLKSKTSFRCCSANSRSFFLKRMKTCSKIVKPVFKKLLCVRNSQLRLKNFGGGDRKDKVKRIGKSNSKRVESDRFSSASGSSVFNSCSESDNEDGEPGFTHRDSLSSSTANTSSPSLKLTNPLPQEKQDKNARWRCREDNKEFSPVSVLDEEIPSEENSPDQDNNRERDAGRIAIPFSPKFMEHLWMDDTNVVTTSQSVPVSYSSTSCYKYLTATRILQQSKQFLIDLVREFVESRAARKGRKQDGRVMEFHGHEQIEKILCEDMRRWNKLSNITELLSPDFKDSVAEWRDYEQQISEISYEIGDAILDDMIADEIVVELLRWHSCLIT